MRTYCGTCLAVLGLALPLPAQCEVGRILASDGAAGDLFGCDVDVVGTRALVGAYLDDDACPADPLCNSGSAYVFELSGGTWTEAAKLVPSDGAYKDHFASSVALSNDWAFCGTSGYDGAAAEAGAVYTYEVSGGSWVERPKLLANDPTGGDGFGFDLDADGGTVVVGTHRAEAAYVFVAGPSGWAQEAKLTASDGAPGAGFGRKVAVLGDLVLVGAPRHDLAGTDAGAVYLFERVGSAWQERERWTAPDAMPGDLFGFALALADGGAVVGAPRSDAQGIDSGAIYWFEPGGGSSWVCAAKNLARSGSAGDQYGASVAVRGVRALAGAWAAAPAGFAQLSRRTPGGLEAELWLEPNGAGAGDAVGVAVALTDEAILLGAKRDDQLGSDAGAAWYLRLHDFATPYCFCDGVGVCGAVDSLGGCPSSTGWGARLFACGSASLSASDLSLHARDLVPAQSALLFAGENAVGGGGGAPLGDGLRCAGGNVVRFDVKLSSAEGSTSWGPGLALPTGWNSGDTRRFQVWYRDPTGGACGASFNLSNGLETTLTP